MKAHPEKQKVAYIRVTRMYIPKSNPAIPKNLFQQIQPEFSGVISPLFPLNIRDMYGSSGILAFRFVKQKKARVVFILTEAIPPNEIETARLSLPLFWFPHGYVVHHFFPFITKTPGLEVPYIELDVHITYPNVAPFAAYYNIMTVVPSWTPPPEILAGSMPIQIQKFAPRLQMNQAYPGTIHQQVPQLYQEKSQQPTMEKTAQLANNKQDENETDSDDSGICLESLDDSTFLNCQNIGNVNDPNASKTIFPGKNETAPPISNEPCPMQQTIMSSNPIQPQQQFIQPPHSQQQYPSQIIPPHIQYPCFTPLPEQSQPFRMANPPSQAETQNANETKSENNQSNDQQNDSDQQMVPE